MKLKTTFSVLLALIMLTGMTSCGDSAVGSEVSTAGSSTQNGTTGSSTSAAAQIISGSSVRLLAGQTTEAGSVSAAIDGSNLVVTYVTTNGWLMREYHLWAGVTLDDMPKAGPGNPKIGHFPYANDALADATSTVVSVPLSAFGINMPVSTQQSVTAVLVAHASLRKLVNGSFQNESAYGEGSRIVPQGNWATYFNVTIEANVTPPPVVAWPAGTAFGYDWGGNNAPFTSLVTTSNWGWTIGPISEGTYTYDLLLDAGDNDPFEADICGNVVVVYSGGTVTADFQTFVSFRLESTQVYVGSATLPLVGGSPSIDPTHYGSSHTLDGSQSTDSFSISGQSGARYVIFHADVRDTLDDEPVGGR